MFKPIKSLNLVADGRFWRSSKRGISGCNWGENNSLPDKIRMCSDAFNLKASIIDRLADDANITIVNYYKDIWLGTYQIIGSILKDWANKNGYYRAQSGKLFLAAPISLWTLKEKNENAQKDKERQKEMLNRQSSLFAIKIKC